MKKRRHTEHVCVEEEKSDQADEVAAGPIVELRPLWNEGLDLHILSVQTLDASLAVADFGAVIGCDSAGIDIDAGDFAPNHHHAYAVGNSPADRRENEVTARVLVRILVQKPHADSVVQVH